MYLTAGTDCHTETIDNGMNTKIASQPQSIF